MKRFSSFVLILALAGALWLYGFVGFVAAIENMNEPALSPALEKTDAIVVLTGGSERLTTGIDLLESGIGKKLLISGVHHGLTLETIHANRQIPADLRACCIILGYQAGSTSGNAEETRIWMDIEQYKSLRLVTANYHMPRSLLLFHAAMPDIKIIPHPIAPDSLDLSVWWLNPHTTELLALEYSKYLLTAMREGDWRPDSLFQSPTSNLQTPPAP